MNGIHPGLLNPAVKCTAPVYEVVGCWDEMIRLASQISTKVIVVDVEDFLLYQSRASLSNGGC